MKIESNIVLESDSIIESMMWIRSALQAPMDADQKNEFFKQAQTALLENAQKIANDAFQMGVDFGKKNN